MTRWRQVATIARWEFNRFVKWRQQFIRVVLMLFLGALVSGVSKLASGSRTGRRARPRGKDRVHLAERRFNTVHCEPPHARVADSGHIQEARHVRSHASRLS